MVGDIFGSWFLRWCVPPCQETGDGCRRINCDGNPPVNVIPSLTQQRCRSGRFACVTRARSGSAGGRVLPWPGAGPHCGDPAGLELALQCR